MSYDSDLNKLTPDELIIRLQSIQIVYYGIHIFGCISTLMSLFLVLTGHYIILCFSVACVAWLLINISALIRMRDKVVERLQVLGKYKK